MKLPKQKTYKQLLKELDKIFSLYIRTRDKGQCFTCPTKKPIKEMHAGHYISRRILSTRFYDKNVFCQCPKCNIFQEGNKPQFAINLQKKFSNGILNELDQLSKIQVKFSRDRLSNMILHYKKELIKL